jgi:hypothetical protein
MKAIQVRSTGGPEVLEYAYFLTLCPNPEKCSSGSHLRRKFYESAVDAGALDFMAKMLVQTSSRFRSSTNFGR